MIYLPQILLTALLLVAAAFFAAAETALFSLSAIERRRLQSRHPRFQRVIDDLLDRPRRTLITLLIGNNLVHILASAVVSILAMDWLGSQGVGVAIALFTFILIVLGEMIPKTIAVRHNESISMLAAFPLQIFAKMIMPLRRLVRGVTDWALALLLRGQVRPSDMISDKELRALVQIVQEEGILDEAEGQRLERLFALEQRTVKEIMTPRTDLIAFDIQDDCHELTRLVKTYHYTYLPVYQESMDHILGVISTQEFMLFPERKIQDLIKAPHYIPETKRIDELLVEMKKTKIHFAMCVDEYGGTAGLVTLEDILEEIFGEIYDEYAHKQTLIMKVGKDEYLVDGRISLMRFNQELHVEMNSESSETLSGLILEHLGRIPRLKETLKMDPYVFEIREIDRQRISKIYVRKSP